MKKLLILSTLILSSISFEVNAQSRFFELGFSDDGNRFTLDTQGVGNSVYRIFIRDADRNTKSMDIATNCKNQTIRIVNITVYDFNGQIIRENNTPSEESVPGNNSPGGKALRYICNSR